MQEKIPKGCSREQGARSSEALHFLANQQANRALSRARVLLIRASQPFGSGLLYALYTLIVLLLHPSVFNEKSHYSRYLRIEKLQLDLDMSFVRNPNEFAN